MILESLNDWSPITISFTFSIAETHHSITDEELRRCYKIFSEMSSLEIKEIAQQTFKFIKMKEVSKDYYEFIPLQPFWTENDWNKLWKERMARRISPRENKVYPWRTILSSEISKISTTLTRESKLEPDLCFFKSEKNTSNIDKGPLSLTVDEKTVPYKP